MHAPAVSQKHMLGKIRMGMYVSSTQEETFLLLRRYLMVRFDEILDMDSPSYVKAELSPFYLSEGKLGMQLHFHWTTGWFLRSKGNAKGIVEATVEKRNGGSYVNFNFDFFKEYRESLIIWGILLLFLNILLGYLELSHPTNIAWIIIGLINVVMLIGVGLSILGDFRNVDLTKQGFTKGFESFVESNGPERSS